MPSQAEKIIAPIIEEMESRFPEATIARACIGALHSAGFEVVPAAATEALVVEVCSHCGGIADMNAHGHPIDEVPEWHWEKVTYVPVNQRWSLFTEDELVILSSSLWRDLLSRTDIGLAMAQAVDARLEQIRMEALRAQ